MSNKSAQITSNGFIFFSPKRGLIQVSNNFPRYEELLGELLSENFDEDTFVKHISMYANPDLKEVSAGSIESKGDGFVYKDDDGSLLDLPAPIYAKAQELITKGASWEHLKKFWQRCLANPRPGSVHQLFEFVSEHLLTITDDGLFVAYKGVGADYYDKHSHTYDNHPGTTITMARDQVTYDPNQTCSSGLHVANYRYASSWGEKVVVVLVDPADVVSVPVDSNAEKIRVCRYQVISEYREEHAFKETPVVDKNLNTLNQPEALDRDRPWTDDEDKMLLRFMAADRDDIEELANRLKRSVTSVYNQIRFLRDEAKNEDYSEEVDANAANEDKDYCDGCCGWCDHRDTCDDWRVCDAGDVAVSDKVVPLVDWRSVDTRLSERDFYRFRALFLGHGKQWTKIAELLKTKESPDYLRRLANRLHWC